MNTLTHPVFAAGGNVRECRFVTPDTVAGRAVEASGSGNPLIGVSYESSRNFPGSASDDSFVAIANEPLPYHGPFQLCNIVAGAAVTVNSPLTSDAQGRGIMVANLNAANASVVTPVWIGAIALQVALAAGEKILCYTVSPHFMKTA